MKTLHPIPSLLLGLGLATASLQAETLVVLPGTSIQAKIDEAVDGDIIAIFGGTYTETLTINKAIRFAEVQGQDVIFQGNLTFTNDVENPPPLEGFTFSNNNLVHFLSSGSIIVRNCDFTQGGNLTVEPPDDASATVLIEGGEYHQISFKDREDQEGQEVPHLQASVKDVTLTADLWIGRTGSGKTSSLVEVENCQLAGITHNSGSLHVTNSTAGHITSNGARKTLLADVEFQRGDFRATSPVSLFRVEVSGGISFRECTKAWIGYSKVTPTGQIHVWNDGDNFVDFSCVGNELGSPENTDTITSLRIRNRVHAIVANNKIWGQHGWGAGDADRNHCITLTPAVGSRITIKNNFLHHTWELSNPAAIRVFGATAEVQIKVLNNVIYNTHGTIISSGLGPVVEGNVLFGGARWGQGGVVIDTSNNNHYELAQNPGFAGWAGDWHDVAPGAADVYTLAEDSVLRDAGSDNPLYNDRDGTRNDAGPSGGVWYDPEGWTTDRPVVISFDINPEVVLEGVDTEVIVSGGTAVSAP